MPQDISSASTQRPQKIRAGEQAYLRTQAQRILSSGGSEEDVVSFVQTHIGLPRPERIFSQAIAGSFEPRGEGEEPPEDAAMGLVGGLSMNALQGITFGFGDEAVGSIVGMLVGEGAAAGREAYRERLERWNAANPGKALSAELAGGFLTGAGAFKAGTTVARTVGRRVGAAALEGAGFGALAGAGHAEGNLSDRTLAAVSGGLLGGLGGGALSAGASASGAVLKPVARSVLERFKGLQSRIPGLRSSRDHANNNVLDILGADDLDLEAVRAKAASLRASGVSPTLADVGEDGTLALLREVTSSVSPVKNRLREAYVTRQNEQGARLSGGMLARIIRGDHFGLRNAYEAVDDLAVQRANAAAPLYQEAYQGIVPVSPRMKQILSTPEFRAAYEQGKRAAERDALAGLGLGLDIPDLPTTSLRDAARRQLVDLGASEESITAALAGFPDDFPTHLPIRAIDYMKKGLNAVQARLAKSNAALDSQGKAALTRVLNEVLKEADEAVPVYGWGRQIWSDMSTAMDAVQAGQDFLKLPPALVSKALDDLGPGAEDFYRLGAAQTLYERSLAKGEGADVAASIFGGRVHNTETLDAQRIRALFPDAPEVAEDFMRQVAAEARVSRVTSNVARPRAAVIKEAESAAELEPFNVRMTPQLTILGELQQGVARLTRAFRRDVSEDVAEMFYKGMDDPREFDLLIERLEHAQIMRSVRAKREERTRRGVSAAVGILAGKLTGGASN